MSTHTQWGRERGPAPPPEAIALSTNEPQHPHLVTILMNVVPWVTIGVTLTFFLLWLLSSLAGDADIPALTIFVMMTVLSAFSWLARMALRGLCDQIDTLRREP